jgi:hypothetical protein
MINIDDVPARPIPAARALADKALLREMVASTNLAPQRLRKRRPRLFVLSIVTGLGLTGVTAAAAYTYLAPRSASVHDSARCYSSVSTATGGHFPGTTIGVAHVVGLPKQDTAVEALQDCAGLWQRGFLTAKGYAAPDVPKGPDGLPPADQPVPPLVACVLRSGQAAVFPGPATVCAQLGLPLLSTQ